MEEEKAKMEQEQETQRIKLTDEIRNRETEVKTINKINQKLKEESRKLQINPISNGGSVQKTFRDSETQYDTEMLCDTITGSLEQIAEVTESNES